MSADDAPLVTLAPAAAPRPGLFQAALLTVGFAVVLFGTIILVVIPVVLFDLWDAPPAAGPPTGAKAGSVDALSPAVRAVLAWSFPAGYAAGFVFAVIVLRLVVGRGWTRTVGLRQLPLRHLGLGLLALPAFVILSDGLAALLFRLFGMADLLDQSGELGKLFHGFPPAFVLLAVGVGPGVVEELWCRGLLGRGLVGRYGWAKGVALASLFFGLLHLYPPPYVVVTAAMGACLHFAYACSRSLWVPVAIHTLNNGFAGLAAVGAAPTGGMDRALAAAPALVYALSAVVLVGCGWAMWTARLVADGPRGEMVPPGGVRARRLHPAAAGLALASAAALVGVLAWY